jgi:hypothetical protein
VTAPSEAFASLRQLAASVQESRPGADTEALADRLLERVSCRADALVLRDGLVELGARGLFEAPR